MYRALCSATIFGLGACSAPNVSGTLVEGLTGEPVASARVVARAIDSDKLTCQADEARTDELGRFEFERLCANVTYRVDPADDVHVLAGVDEVSTGTHGGAPLDVTRWWMPPGDGVYEMSDDGRVSVRPSVDLGTETLEGTQLKYPKTIPARVRTIQNTEYLVLTGAYADTGNILPLVEAPSREWFYLGVRFEDIDSFKPVEVTLADDKVIQRAIKNRRARYVRADALPNGRYMVVAEGKGRARMVDFGQSYDITSDAPDEM